MDKVNLNSFLKNNPLSLESAIELNLNIRMLTYDRYCIRQFFDIDNSFNYNTYDCNEKDCSECIKNWFIEEKVNTKEVEENE